LPTAKLSYFPFIKVASILPQAKAQREIQSFTQILTEEKCMI
jgi:hypothetical protein